MDHRMEIVAAIVFALALIHTFTAKSFDILSNRHPNHAGLFHLLGEVEVVFGFWAFILIALLAIFAGSDNAINYVESRHYTEPMFVFVVMVVAASQPVLGVVRGLITLIAKIVPVNNILAQVWLNLAAVPLLGSLITEPAAMTIAALMLAPQVFKQGMPEWLKYAALGVLFVNISIGGTLTSYAAPPVLMVAKAWEWDSAFMASTFGWKAAIAVLINATVVCYMLRQHLVNIKDSIAPLDKVKTPIMVSVIHILFLIGVVVFAHHPVIFFGLFLFFLGFTQAYERYQSPLILKEGLLVGFFLAGLVVLGGMQQWWLQPIVSSLAPLQLFFGAVALTAITDNAALTFLGSQIIGLSDITKYMLMAGAIAGGGLTLIANAPNPAGAALLKKGFDDGSIGAGQLLLGALPPTIVAAILFLI
ncbi:MAG: putative Na+/H+ antiporter [Methylophilaceae bacterium]|nr:putative Na+/H+ antiporter [Methylophilaceae bacterium]